MKLITTLAIFLTPYLVLCQKYEVPTTKIEIVEDVYFEDQKVADSYRWLENIRSPEVIQWIETQNKISKKFLARTTDKTSSYRQIDKLSNVQYSNPTKMGDYYFSYSYYNTMGLPALFYRKSINQRSELLVDPNFISKKDNIQIGGIAVSGDSKLLAYQFNRNGSDWKELKVINLKTKKHEDDHLMDLKFSAIAWKGDGFYYLSYPNNDNLEQTTGAMVKYHKLGTPQSEDELVFKRKYKPNVEFDFLTTSDERYFILSEKNEQKGKINIFYIDFESDIKKIRPLLVNLKNEVNIIDHAGDKLVATTFKDNNTGAIVKIDPTNPLKWDVIVPPFSEAVLVGVKVFENRIIAVYQSNQQPMVTIYDFDGKTLQNIEFPLGSSVRGFNGKYDDKEIIFSFQSYHIPSVVYSLNLETYERELTNKTAVSYDYSNIKCEQINCESSDGALIPTLILYDDNFKKDGNSPAILSAYGGFGSINSPYFSEGIIYFIKKGGVYAFANIRGGGDKGADWMTAGQGKNKQTSFDDFITVSEFLIKEGWTSANRLGITGASNGGLVVAAAAMQRPDLYQAVVPVVAPTDMLRFEKFTVGVFHKDEYGSVATKEGFDLLKSYSPYHNINDKINYPAMLFITGENDDRVPAFHSYKMVAGLQNRPYQKNPILLKSGKNVGHSGSSNLLNSIKDQAEIMGFFVNELTK